MFRRRSCGLNKVILEEWQEYQGDVNAIAEKYNVTQGNVYYHLRTVCAQKGFSYESMLRYPHKKHENYRRKETMLYIKGRRLSLKQIRVYIKEKGWTALDFSEYFNVSEEEFLEVLKEITKSYYDSYRRDMEKNKKDKSKLKRGERQMETPKVAETQETSETYETTPIFANIPTECEEETKPEASELDVISMKISIARENFDKEENIYRELAGSYQNIQGAIVLKNAELLKYEEEVEKARRALAKLHETENDIEEKMYASLDKKIMFEKELEELEQQYKAAQTTFIYFDTELRTSLPLPEGVEVTDEMLRTKRNELLDYEACEDVSAKVLKAVASILCMVEALTAASFKAEIAEDRCNDDVAIALELLNESGVNILFAS